MLKMGLVNFLRLLEIPDLADIQPVFLHEIFAHFHTGGQHVFDQGIDSVVGALGNQRKQRRLQNIDAG